MSKTDNEPYCVACNGRVQVMKDAQDQEIYRCENTEEWGWYCKECNIKFHGNNKPYSLDGRTFCPNCHTDDYLTHGYEFMNYLMRK